MKPPALAQPFTRRMAPLALLTFVLVGVLLPAGYQTLALDHRADEARTWALHVAERLEPAARARPALWAFDTVALTRATGFVVEPPIKARVRVDVSGHDAVFVAGPKDQARTVSGWAPVRVEGGIGGRVEVRLPGEDVRGDVGRVWLIAATIGIVLGAALFFLPVATVRRSEEHALELYRALAVANTELEARVSERTEALVRREHQLRELGARLLAVQEDERRRISRDLHDELGQTLTGLRLRLASLEASPTDAERRAHLEAAATAVDAAIEEVRRLAHNLRPAALDGLGLADALRSHAQGWAEIAGVDLRIAIDPVSVDDRFAEAVFRVAQEALTNIARHARAARATLTVARRDDGIVLEITDDGVGLPTGETDGIGLVGARERVEHLGGYLDVEDGPEGGVCLTMWLPSEG